MFMIGTNKPTKQYHAIPCWKINLTQVESQHIPSHQPCSPKCQRSVKRLLGNPDRRRQRSLCKTLWMALSISNAGQYWTLLGMGNALQLSLWMDWLMEIMHLSQVIWQMKMRMEVLSNTKKSENLVFKCVQIIETHPPRYRVFFLTGTPLKS